MADVVGLGGFASTRVVLLGTGSHDPDSGLPDVPAVATTLVDLEKALVSRCGLPLPSITRLLDPPTSNEIGSAVLEAARHATDLLLVHFVGHGVVDSRGRLYLASRSTRNDSEHAFTGLPYEVVGNIVRESAAKHRIVMLDCCYAGRALDGLSGLGPPQDRIADQTHMFGGYLLAAASRDEMALAPMDAAHTAFTGALIGLLNDGDPQGDGLIPALGRGDLKVTGSESWPRLVFTPTANPVEALAARVASVTGLSAADVVKELHIDPARLPVLLRRCLDGVTDRQSADRPRFVVIVDQFEEAFTLCRRPSEQQVFIQALMAAADTGTADIPAALVVLGLRSDFYGQCADYSDLAPILRDAPVVVQAMTKTEVREAIENPARLAGFSLEAELLDLLLHDLGIRHDRPLSEEVGGHTATVPVAGAYEAGRLPLLSHALRATWQKQQDGVLTVAGYLSTGRIAHALALTADEAMARFDPAGQETARRLLLRLVHIENGTDLTRRRLSRDRLLDGLPTPQAVAALNAFTADGTRLLTVDKDSVEITHEALIREWPALQSWIERDRADLLIEHDLVDAANQWDERGRRTVDLYQGGNLAAAREWTADRQKRSRLDGTAAAFLDASYRRHRRRGQLRIALTATLATLLVISLAATFVAVHQRQVALDQTRIATSRSLMLQSESLRKSEPATALRLALAANSINTEPEIRASLVTTLMGNRYHGQLLDDGPISSMALSPDGRTLATRNEGKVVLWDIATRSKPFREQVLEGLVTSAGKVAFTPDGRGVISTSFGGAAVMWDLAERSHPRRWTVMDQDLGSGEDVELSSDGRVLVRSELDGSATLFTVRDAAHVDRQATLSGHEHGVTAVALSPDGRTLATGSVEGVVIIWDLGRPSRPVRKATFRPHTDSVDETVFSPDGKTLATVSHDRSATLWNVADPSHPVRQATLARSFDGISAVAFSPDGHTLATGGRDHTVILWDVSKREQPVQRDTLATHTDAVFGVAFSPDGRTLISGSYDGTVIRWDVAPPSQPVRQSTMTGHAQSVLSVALSPDGRTLATGSDDYSVILWDVSKKERPIRRATLTGLSETVMAVAFDPSGKLLTGVGLKHSIIVWDVSDPARPMRRTVLPETANVVEALAFTPDARTMATSSGTTVTLWDVTVPKPLRSWTFSATESIMAVAFSPDGRTLATGDDKGFLALWDIDHPANEIPHTAQSNEGVWATAFSPDKRLLATGGKDGTVILWRIANDGSLTKVATALEHPNPIRTMMFSRDGQILATGGDDNTVTLWEVTADDRLVARAMLLTHTGAVRSITSSLDGQSMITGSDDDTAMVWDVSAVTAIVAQPVDYACAAAGRGLNQKEWTDAVPGLPFRPTCPS